MKRTKLTRNKVAVNIKQKVINYINFIADYIIISMNDFVFAWFLTLQSTPYEKEESIKCMLMGKIYKCLVFKVDTKLSFSIV